MSNHNLYTATHPEGFWDVPRCTRTPLYDARQSGTPRSERVLWFGRWGSRRCVRPVCSWDRTEPADSRTGWSRACTGPRDGGSTCSLDRGTELVTTLFMLSDTGNLYIIVFNMLIRAFVHTLTRDDVVIGGDGVTLIKHKKFPSIETLRELLQVLVDSTFQLVHLFTHILQAGRQNKDFQCKTEMLQTIGVLELKSRTSQLTLERR